MTIDFSNGLVEMKTTSVVCSAVAIIMTLARLIIQRKRIWWDDGWAFFSMLCLLVQVSSVFMHGSNPETLSKTTRVAAYYIIASTFYAVIWSARLAILVSILRIEPDPTYQRGLRIVGVAFFLCVVILISQLFWVCEPQGHTWKNLPDPQCHLTQQVAVMQVLTDVVSDLFLCIWPLRILSGLRSVRLKRRLMVIFCTSTITTIVSLVHVGYLLTTGGIDLLIVALVEDTVSLMVANLPVVLTSSLRLFGRLNNETPIDLDDDDYGGPVMSTFNIASLHFESRQPEMPTIMAGVSSTPGVDVNCTTSTWIEFIRSGMKSIGPVEISLEPGQLPSEGPGSELFKPAESEFEDRGEEHKDDGDWDIQKAVPLGRTENGDEDSESV